MRRARCWGLLLACILSLSGCDVQPEPDGGQDYAELAGSWRWVASTDVQQTEEVFTPASEGYEARLRFDPERTRAGTYRYFRDDSLRVSGRYEIAYEDAPGNDFLRIDESIDFLEEAAWLVLGHDTLRLDGVFEGGYESVYIREP